MRVFIGNQGQVPFIMPQIPYVVVGDCARQLFFFHFQHLKVQYKVTIHCSNDAARINNVGLLTVAHMHHTAISALAYSHNSQLSLLH